MTNKTAKRMNKKKEIEYSIWGLPSGRYNDTVESETKGEMGEISQCDMLNK